LEYGWAIVRIRTPVDVSTTFGFELIVYRLIAVLPLRSVKLT
jgi:hypothetical protein